MIGVPSDHSKINRTLYGRRKGKKLRHHQSELLSRRLPLLAIDCHSGSINPASLFDSKSEETIVEIGFGGGEHILHEARKHPNLGYIGCEPFINGVAKVVSRIEEENLQNIRIHHGDAREVLLRLPSSSLARVDVLYPDPWPKWRQRKRRFLSSENLLEIARVLRPGGCFRFATDIDDYSGWVLARVLKMTSEFSWQEAESLEKSWRDPWSDWPGTRYEAKAFREGRVPVYLTFLRL